MQDTEPTLKFFDPEVPGLRELLLHTEKDKAHRGFCYYPDSPLNIVLYGPPGAGKSILALQMAVAAVNKHWRALYFTKDTPSTVLIKRVTEAFGFFRENPPPPGHDKAPTIYQLQDALKAIATGNEKEIDGRPAAVSLTGLKTPFLGFADFSDAPLAAAGLDRYAMAQSVWESLNYFCPELRPLFDALQDRDDEPGSTQLTPGGLFVVCDSLSPKALESQLRLQTRFTRVERGPHPPIAPPEGTIYLFIMESAELPPGLEVAFPPDVEIKMGIREEPHGVNTRTIQLLKTRFQKSLDEETPFVVFGQDECKCVAWQGEAELAHNDGNKPVWKTCTPSRLFKSKPGIEIMPPLIHEASPAPQDAGQETGFGIADLDSLTDPKGLSGGGCTLLLTENRCGSTALSLHYLLGYRPETTTGRPVESRSSVLLVSFSGDVAEILHTIWKHPLLRDAIWRGASNVDAQKTWNSLKTRLTPKEGDTVTRNPRHRVYSVPLLDWKDARAMGALFHIYIPDFTWVTAEEAMTRLRGLLNEEEGRAVTRLVLSRVGRVPARWPLVENQSIFISALVAYCARRPVEMLLIDDTTVTVPGTGAFQSRWTAMAQNILRLRRVPFHGSETIAIEVIKASGRTIRFWRPWEVVFKPDATGFGDEMCVKDEFRGYTGLSAGRPEHCRVLVELSYDVTHTPLHREVVATQGSLEAAMDQLTVRLLAPGTWSGINSAFHNLSSVSRDTCHVVSIDGIWLKNLLEADVLHRLNDDELKGVLPRHVWPIEGTEQRKDIGDKLEREVASQYVTRSLNTAIQQLEGKRRQDIATGIRFAVPMRHNWGLLAIAKPSKQFIKHVVDAVWDRASVDRSPSSVAHLPPEVTRAVREVLGVVEPEKRIAATKWHGVWKSIWDAGQSPEISYKQLADFRTDYWHDFWRGGWLDRTLTVLAADDKHRGDPWLALFPRIDFFGLALTSPESVVAFLLELLLAHVHFDMLFKADPSNGITLDFANTLDSQEGFTEVLVLFFRLLSRNQRRRIGIAICPDAEAAGVRAHSRLAVTGLSQRAFRDWPNHICLFSREWITTVQDLMPQFDIRERIVLSSLPRGQGDAGKPDATTAYWVKAGFTEQQSTSNGGPTVAGTWYLGILQGGNMDVATDIMKEVLSTGRERQRLLDKCGAPVSQHFYSSAPQGNEASVDPVPYLNLVGQLHQKSSDDCQLSLFPFYRSRIRKYVEVTSLLYDLVCQVMRVQVSENEQLLRSDCEPADVQLTAFTTQIRQFVVASLRGIEKLQQQPDSSAQ